MGYGLGIDLGTTWSAAAIIRDSRAEIVSLGDRSASIPSVLLLREDGSVLVGEAALRRGMAQPDRLAREFKRRLGDTTPIILGGTPLGAEALTARLLSWIVAEVTQREGTGPDRVVVTHPANWGSYKLDLLRNALGMAGLAGAQLLTEPEAAARFYAAQERVEPGSVVAVYDLGGGTFDATVLRKTGSGFEMLGHPDGIERMGGIDVDAAVFAHVVRSIGDRYEALDADDPSVISAVGRLRQECVDAKEALSRDTDASISVLLPGLTDEVRLTRSELEGMVRPALADTVATLRRAIEGAGLTPEGVSRILLVGGSSRIPLVSQLVAAEFGRPVAVDAHPKFAVALGAAMSTEGEAVTPTIIAPVPPEPETGSLPHIPTPPPTPVVPPGAAAGAAAASIFDKPVAPPPAPPMPAGVAWSPAVPPPAAPPPAPPPAAPPPLPPTTVIPPIPPPAGPPTGPPSAPPPGTPAYAAATAARPAWAQGPTGPPPTPPGGYGHGAGRGGSAANKRRAAILIVLAVLALATGAAAYVITSGDDDGDKDLATGSTATTEDDTTTTDDDETTTTDEETTTTTEGSTTTSKRSTTTTASTTTTRPPSTTTTRPAAFSDGEYVVFIDSVDPDARKVTVSRFDEVFGSAAEDACGPFEDGQEPYCLVPNGSPKAIPVSDAAELQVLNEDGISTASVALFEFADETMRFYSFLYDMTVSDGEVIELIARPNAG